jgi:hypothetical protein
MSTKTPNVYFHIYVLLFVTPWHCAYICNTINKRNQVVHYCIDTLHFLFGLNPPIPDELHSGNPEFSLEVSKV